MAKRFIWKFPIDVKDYQEIILPFGCKILSVAEQFGQLYLWGNFRIDDDGECDGKSYTTIKRKIFIYGTGNNIEEKVSDFDFIGTVLTDAGNYVWHIFAGGFVDGSLASAKL